MKYLLAKELKDAGFKQPDRHEMYRGLFRSPEGIDGSFAIDAVYVPTLEELIEACGEKFFSVVLKTEEREHETDMPYCWCTPRQEVFKGGGVAILHNKQTSVFEAFSTVDAQNTIAHHYGSTPSEAVGRLWLALNKKI